jgi:hypothetical protein
MRRFASSEICKVFLGIVASFVRGGHAKADFTFGELINPGPPINSPYDEGSITMTPDGLELYFDRGRIGVGCGLWATKRATVSDPWGEPERIRFTTDSSVIDFGPCLSADGLELYYTSDRDGAWNTLIARRATLSDPWQEPVNIGPAVSLPSGDFGPSISADGLELYFGSDRSGGFGPADLWVTKRESKDDYDSWSKPVNLGSAVNSKDVDNSPFISPDGLMLFFESNRAGGYGDFDIWVSKRKTIKDEWGQAVNLGPSVNSAYTEYLPGTSLDGKQFYFLISDEPRGLGGYDIWQMPIVPIVDFNADRIIDADDMCIMVDHWGEDYFSCDIGPMPWGDGIVDVQDLIVLSEHLFEEVGDQKLVAHWTFDETEGMYAADGVGNNDAVVLGGVEWQPTGGQIDGALKLDGISGYAIAGTVLNPADGPFSIFAWFKDCAPGQVIVSQQNVSNWLAIDSDGNLMTELKSSDQVAEPLVSETVITDGQWHRVGLAWDGTQRTLCVDGTMVAEDTQPGLESSQMGLYIGVDKYFTPGTFFSGLIDDIRIYNRVVSP